MNKAFWKDAFERAANSVWQSTAALYGTDVLNLTHLGWHTILVAAGGAAWLSLTKSLASAQITGTASLVPSKKNAVTDGQLVLKLLAQKLSK